MAVNTTNLQNQVQNRIDNITGSESLEDLLVLRKAADNLSLSLATIEAAISAKITALDAASSNEDLLIANRASGLSPVTGGSSRNVGELIRMSANAPIDFTENGARYLRSGYVELDEDEFNTSFWQPVRINPEVIATPLNPIAIADNGAGTIVAVTSGTISTGIIMLSTDAGKTWNTVTPGVAGTYTVTANTNEERRVALAFIDGFFYLGLKAGNNAAACGILRSSDGLTWTILNSGLAGTTTTTVQVVDMFKAGDNLIFVTTTRVFRSINNGTSWAEIRTVPSGFRYTKGSTTSDGRVYLIGTNDTDSFFHHSSADQSTWFERSITGVRLFSLFVTLSSGTYLIRITGATGAGFAMRNANFSVVQLDGSTSLSTTTNSAVGGINSVVGDYLEDGSKTLMLVGRLLYESNSAQATSGFALRLGREPYQTSFIVKGLTGFFYGIPSGSPNSFFRFKDLVPAAGIPFEISENNGQVIGYARIS